MSSSALNITLISYHKIKTLYGIIPRISLLILLRRTRFSGHCYRSKNEIISEVISWIPKHGHTNVAHPRINYIDQLNEYGGLNLDKVRSAMMDKVN